MAKSNKIILENNVRIFFIRDAINNKACSMIIDGGDCTNVESTTLVERLSLCTMTHPRLTRPDSQSGTRQPPR